MIAPHQTLIRTGELARELAISESTLCRWTSEGGSQWRAALIRRGWYSVPRLRAAGLLTPATVSPQPLHEGHTDVG